MALPLVDTTNCEVCAAELTDDERKPKKPLLNGLPESMTACDLCRGAVKRRELGVSINTQGKIHIIGTDGQGCQRGGI